MNQDRIIIQERAVNCLIGILADERRTPQKLLLSAELDLDLNEAACSGDVAHTVDYGGLAAQLDFILRAGAFGLLETAALALCHYLLAPPQGHAPWLSAAAVTLTKPDALGGNGTPSVRMFRARQDISQAHRPVESGRVDTLFVGAQRAIVRLHGAALPPVLPDFLPVGRPHELVLDASTRLLVIAPFP